MPSVALVTTDARVQVNPTDPDAFNLDSGATGSNRVLAVIFACTSTSDPGARTATYDGNGADYTYTQNYIIGTGNDIYTSLFIFVNPTTGTNTFSVDYATAAPTGDSGLVALVYENVDQTNPLDSAPDQKASNSSGTAHSYTTSNADLMLVCMAAISDGDNVFTAEGPMTIQRQGGPPTSTDEGIQLMGEDDLKTSTGTFTASDWTASIAEKFCSYMFGLVEGGSGSVAAQKASWF